jgi:hypothetical protein
MGAEFRETSEVSRNRYFHAMPTATESSFASYTATDENMCDWGMEMRNYPALVENSTVGQSNTFMRRSWITSWGWRNRPLRWQDGVIFG